MKKIFLLLLSLIAQYSESLFAIETKRDDLILKIESKIDKYYDKKITGIPEAVRLELLKFDSYNRLNTATANTQLWLHENFSQMDDKEIADILLNFDELRGGDDVFKLVSEGFWCRLKGKPLEFEARISLTGTYWKENDRPNINLAPVSRGSIEWIWKLDVPERTFGVLHVGIDLKTRVFVCFENTVGIYYPEGDILERIRAEIIQNPAMAGTRIGKGYLSDKAKNR